MTDRIAVYMQASLQTIPPIGRGRWSVALQQQPPPGRSLCWSLASTSSCRFLVPLLFLSLATACARTEGPQEATSVKGDPLKLAAVDFVSRRDWSPLRPGLNLQGGEKVLLAVTSAVDLTLVEAVRTAVREKGGFLDVILLDKNLYADELRVDWIDLPKLKAYDKLVASREIRENLKLPAILFKWSSEREFLESYPSALLEQIDKEVWAVMRTAGSVRFTAPNGTDLTFTLDDFHWQQMGGDRQDYSPVPGLSFRPNHLKFNPAKTRRPDASGTIVTTDITHATHPKIPEMRWILKNGKIVEISGGGEVGEKLRKLSERYKDRDFGVYPGPGFNWLTEFTLDTQPGLTPGRVHVSLGEDLTDKGLIDDPDYRDLDYHIYGGTLTIDGKTLVEEGRLLVLERPEIRKQLLEHEKLLSQAR